MELEFFAAGDDGVAGVISACESNDKTGLASQNINEFSFGFVAPLGAYYHKCWHYLAHP